MKIKIGDKFTIDSIEVFEVEVKGMRDTFWGRYIYYSIGSSTHLFRMEEKWFIRKIITTE
jgi:hypothetical protein